MFVVGVDFETYPIPDNRAEYPPKPVGVSIKYSGRPGYYLGWGHDSDDNNSTYEFAAQTLRDIWRSAAKGECVLVFHHAKYDLAVARKWFPELPELPWDAIHDTMILGYLVDPHARKIDLKKMAEEYLDMPATERDELAEWIADNTKELQRRHPWNLEWDEKKGRYTKPHRIAPTKAGRWYFAAPCELTGRYANGDTERTVLLFEHLYDVVLDNGMGAAYDRERRLLPILMENERDGMRVDVEALRDDVDYYSDVLEYVEDWLRDRLQAPGLSFDNDRDVAEIFDLRGIVDPENWKFTKSGNKWIAKMKAKTGREPAPEDVPEQYRSVSKDNLPPSSYNDQEVAQAFGYRNRLVTCLKMFMKPWLKMAEQTGGYIATNWNSVASDKGGTRTGRPSTSNPNFLNLSKNFEGRSDGYEHPAFLDIEPLPLVRKYILPDPGHVFLHRDFSGQEVRIFGHFEQGELCDAYNANPALDPHSWLKDLIKEVVGKVLERTRVKNVTFSRLYGGGAPSVYIQARCASLQEAKELLDAHDKALPGRKLVVDEIKRVVRSGRPIKTWGGRLYFPEEPEVIDGRRRTKEYKLINYLVQGSAADLTKECLIRWYNHPDRDPRTRFMVTVYDEINITCPEDCWEDQMRLLQHCMEDVDLDVPMLSEGKVGRSWHDTTVCVSMGDYVEQDCPSCGSRHVQVTSDTAVRCHLCGETGWLNEDVIFMRSVA